MPLKFRDFARCFIGSKHAPASAPVPAVSLPDNDDLLCEILLRLPPLPSSLARASLVCKRWRGLVTDPFFLRRFRQHHHRTPPLLGYFFSHPRGPVFVSTLAPPDCIPPERFSLPRQPAAGERLFFLGCRHGLTLLINRTSLHAVVWDPVTGCQATVAYPGEFTTDNGAHCCRGTVLSTAAATADHGDGQLRPFKVILIRIDDADNGHIIRVSVCVYESQTRKWGRTIAIATTVIPLSVSNLPNVLVGNALYGFLRWPKGFLELDLERHTLGVIQTPKRLHHPIDRSFFQIVRTQDDGGELGLAILSKMSMELWGRKAMAKANSSSDGVVRWRWVLQKTIQLDNLLKVPRMNMMHTNLPAARILGFDEDNNVIHVSTFSGGAFAIRLDSMKFTGLFNVNRIGSYQSCYPYTGFYTGVPRLPTA
ncbi:uncharacterized protein LOC8061922 [Sorghum bicolor]|uniref:F-box domain-containing protein n=1 Tax=Sorghum bicolor TaxID=4558 RepID=A0A1B6P7T4_SORBI|nr:uncharacterized protein LOC8061922 [Sorghum bicolor]KXG21819.1 hypothetical protein SORBI_3009G112000 [Sorghum bicolor]|eukprot:XP_002440968.2 uncharacterized protein LOC8061922 [Sorghum bicolor]